MARYELSLLGTPTLTVDGTDVHVSRRKAMALLAYLAVTGRAHTRDALATLLWPESDTSTARGALRRRLSQLNQLLGGVGLDADRETVRLKPDLDLWLDVSEFRRLRAGCDEHAHGSAEACAACLDHLEQAVALYTDHFMAGFSLDDSAAYDAWQASCAESLKQEVADALVRAANCEASLGDLEQAISYTLRWLTLDPLAEPAHRHMMVLLARANRRTAALRQYETCCDVLQTELGAEPSQRTQQVYQQLLRDELPSAPGTVEAILERQVRSVGPCPYRGLAPFREVDAGLFFGRETYVERLRGALDKPPFVTAVVGPSGSGKSSVVSAGLLPDLRQDPGWLIVPLRPGAQPFRALAESLIPFLEPDLSETARLVERRYLAKALREGDVTLGEIVTRIREKADDGSRVLLFVDQFEETYTLCTDPQIRTTFIDALLSAVQTASPGRYGQAPASLLLTLRADFMGQALAHRPFADVIQTAIQVLGPMTREELVDAIAKPAEAQGAAFEAGLVARLLDDVADAPGNLPLLQFALTLLWERLDFGWLTHATYDQIGGTAGALARYAQEEFEALTPEDQSLARRVFVQLVQPGEGTEDTRRVATRADVGEAAWDLVHHLADRRLVVAGGNAGEETVEVVHEALIQHWDQLQAWMAEDRAFRTWQERLRISVGTWLNTDRDEGVLLRGVPLAEAERGLVARGGDLTPTERAFIEASVDLRERRAAERAAVLAREREAARRLADAHEQVLREREEALRQAAVGLASEALRQLQGPRQDIALTLVLEAVESYPYTSQAELALAQVAAEQRLVRAFEHSALPCGTGRVSPDDRRILTCTDSGILTVWDLESGRRLFRLRAHEQAGGYHMRANWSPSGDRILTAASGDRVHRIWTSDGGALLTEIAAHGGYYAHWSPDGTQVVSSYSFQEDAATLWCAETGAALHVLPGDRGMVKLARFSPDGSRVVTSLGDVWDTQTGGLLLRLTEYQPLTTSDDQVFYAWSSGGRRLGASMGDTAFVWDAATGEVTLKLKTGYRGRASLFWSPDDTFALTVGHQQPAQLWEIAGGRLVRQMPARAIYNNVYNSLPWSPDSTQVLIQDTPGHVSTYCVTPGRDAVGTSAHDGAVARVRWLTDSRRFLTTGDDGWTRIWRTEAAHLSVGCWPNCPFSDRGGFCRPPAWSRAGDLVGRSYVNGVARLWEVGSGTEKQIPGQADCGSEGIGLAWSPDGTRLLTATADGEIRILDGSGFGPLGKWSTGAEPLWEAQWSPGGQRILSVNRNGVAAVWDAETGERLSAYAEHNAYTAAWSPDGSEIVTADLYGAGGPPRVWRAETGRTVRVMASSSSDYAVSAVAWSPCGTQITAFCTDQRARVWGADTGERQAVFVTVPNGQGAAYSPSGQRVLVGGASGIYVYQIGTWHEVARYPADEQAYASWSPDGRAIAISYYNGDLKVFPAWESLDDLVTFAKEKRLRRELTPEERARFGLPKRE